MDKNRFIELLVKEDSGEITPLELKELQALEDAYPDFSVLRHIYTTTGFEIASERRQAAQTPQQKALFKKIAQQILPAPKKASGTVVYWYKWWAAAVILGLLLALPVLFLIRKKDLPTSPTLVTTQKGARQELILPDGTKVWLNADSRFSYPENFAATAREVTLTGEAFFEVTKDAKRPFIVHTKNIDVKVLGTRFNLRAYPGETSSQTTLLKGAVEVLLKNNKDKRVLLSPNEKLIVQNKAVKESASSPEDLALPEKVDLVAVQQNLNDSSTSETEWTQGRLVFKSERIEDMIPVLERWYNTTIVFKGRQSRQTFSGSFKNAPLDDVLKALKISAGINYKTENGRTEMY